MFESNALPLPPIHDYNPRSLRPNSNISRPQPQGGCHYQDPLNRGPHCQCQTYQHNQTLGNICDCGHSACYHSQISVERKALPDYVVSALLDKVKKLEDIVIKERETRNNTLAQERQAWDREIRVLREALSPFYQSESDVKRRLGQIEDRLDSSAHEQKRLQERMAAMGEVSLTFEKHLESRENIRNSRKRKSSSSQAKGVMSPVSNYACSSSSPVSDATSLSTQRSPQPASPKDLALSTGLSVKSPRSSGILHSKTGRAFSQPCQTVPLNPQNSGIMQEPRSSGFLSIDLAERLRKEKILRTSAHVSQLENRAYDPLHDTPSSSSGLSSLPRSKIRSGALPLTSLLADTGNSLDSRAPKRYKPESRGMVALEILANATVGRAQVR